MSIGASSGRQPTKAQYRMDDPLLLSQAHPYYYLVRLARIGVSGTDIDAPEVCRL